VVIMVVAFAIGNAVFDIIRNALSQFSYGRTLGRIAQVGIIALAAIAALNQIGVVTAVSMSILIAALATMAGILIVGVGGGMIRPMQERWERMLNKAESETAKVASTVRDNSANAKPGDMMKPAGDGITQPGYKSGQEGDRDVKTTAERASEETPR
jgi:hypothetical protein